MPSNYPSFSNRNFGYPPQQQQPPSNDSQKVYHVPIHIEKDDQSNSYVKISDPSGFQASQQQPQSAYPTNYQQPRPSNNYFQSNPAEQMHYERSYSPSNRTSSPFYNNAADANHLNDFRDRSEQEFKRQSEELFKKLGEEPRGASAGKAPSTGNQSNEYRIPIRIEGESDSSNLVRDFNKMHCPSAVRTSKPGQKNSTPAGDYVDNKNFNSVPASYQHQPQFNQQTSHHFDQQQQQQQQNHPAQQQRPAQQPKKPASPMAIVQDILEEVENYEHEVDYFKGTYQDKQWKYLDEMLTRCMLKLDTIDTCGDMNLKQARKNALNYINKVIAKLENIEKAQGGGKEETTEKVGEKSGEEKAAESNAMEDEAHSKQTNDESNKEDANRQSQSEEAAKEAELAKVENKSKDKQSRKESDDPKEKGDKKAKAEKKKASKKPDGKDKKKIKKENTDQNRDN